MITSVLLGGAAVGILILSVLFQFVMRKLKLKNVSLLACILGMLIAAWCVWENAKPNLYWDFELTRNTVREVYAINIIEKGFPMSFSGVSTSEDTNLTPSQILSKELGDGLEHQGLMTVGLNAGICFLMVIASVVIFEVCRRNAEGRGLLNRTFPLISGKIHLATIGIALIVLIVFTRINLELGYTPEFKTYLAVFEAHKIPEKHVGSMLSEVKTHQRGWPVAYNRLDRNTYYGDSFNNLNYSALSIDILVALAVAVFLGIISEYAINRKSANLSAV